MTLSDYVAFACLHLLLYIYPSLFVGISRQLYQNTCKAFLNDHAITLYVIYF